ncbi:hypothetical protein ACFY9G_40585 [Streptomyces anthocyanicus]|uniref:hypothetical protein n=2 Tax=Streptomyces TaxID=1883 RepID=UPI0029B1BEE5|nr:MULTISPECIES: hypothetical protein [Streptomyces]MDX3351715.1 hypothetical protein [Streptomyces sp. ME02-6979A]
MRNPGGPGIWHSSEQYNPPNISEAETAHYTLLKNKRARLDEAYNSWYAIPADRRPIPHIKVIAGHAGKRNINGVTFGYLAAFQEMHGIPAGTLTFEHDSRGKPVAVKETSPGAWKPWEHQPPSEISGIGMAYSAQVNSTQARTGKVYDAWYAIPADRRPIPHIKVIAGHAGKNHSRDVKPEHLAAFQEMHGIPAGTLTLERNSHSNPVAVKETSPGAWNQALRAVPSAAADSLVTEYGHTPRVDPSATHLSATEDRAPSFGPSAPTSSGHPGYGDPLHSDAAPTGYYPDTINSNYSTNTSYNPLQTPEESTPAETYPPNHYSYYSTASVFTAQQPASSAPEYESEADAFLQKYGYIAPAYENESEADAFLQEYGQYLPGHRTPPNPLLDTAAAYAPPPTRRTQPPTQTTKARSTAPTRHQPQQPRRPGR